MVCTRDSVERVVLRQVDRVKRVDDVHMDIHRRRSHLRLDRCHGRLRVDLESS